METPIRYFIIDFDSTFMKVEGMEELGAVALANDKNKDQILRQIQAITDLGMSGQLSLSESLEQRINLLNAHKDDIPVLIERLRHKVSDSFARNRTFFREFADQIFIISNGFREFIVPIVTEFGIKPENVFANTFETDASGKIIGFDRKNRLSANKGKVEQIKSLNLQGDIFVIGDGYTDYEIKEAGLANRFYAFTENVEREKVMQNADFIAPSFEEFLYHNNLPRKFSYPKNRISVLLLENIHPKAVEIFREEGFKVEIVNGGLDEDELCERIREVSVLGIRSKTQVTRKVLESANKLMAVGAFCIGTNQIDLATCLEKGVVAFNAPYSNTRSVVELAIAEIIMLIRNIPDKSHRMHQGIWDKSAKNSFEIRGKKLGLIGYGNIGTQLSVLAENLGMEVYYYDVVEKLALGNARRCKTLDELLSLSDVVSLHVDGRQSNTHLIDHQAFAKMKSGVIFLNLSRGHVVDIAALVEAVKSGKVAGVGVDVFPYEPKTNEEAFLSELRDLPNVILTPHIGGSTEEAQANIGSFVPGKLLEFINKGNTFGSVNFPEIQLPELQEAHRLIHIHRNVPGMLAKINGILSAHKINILGQYLKTNEKIGYVITDIARSYSEGAIAELKNIDNTIKFRMLY
jgi:D-3-phosphoglycerate dehydrogenase / 2-oxoglutarate reductase